MKILFTTPIFEYPTIHGPSLRIANTLIALSKVAEIYLLILSPTESNQNDVRKFVVSHNIHLVINPFSRLHKLGIVSLVSKIEAYYLSTIIKFIKSNTIWFGYGCMTVPLIKECLHQNSKIKVISDTDSVQSRYFLRKLPYLSNKSDYKQTQHIGEALEKEEKQLVELSKVVIAVSEVDQDYYQKLGQGKNNVKLVYNAIDVNHYQQTQDPGLAHPAVILTGWYGKGSPMEDAANWLIHKIWPQVIRKRPDTHLYLVGKGSLSTMGDGSSQNIHVIGEVPDMAPYLTNADVAVVPLRFESGTRFKILEASASMVPVVSTTLGAEGLKLTAGKHILIADKPNEFAKCIIQLLNSPTQRKMLSYSAHIAVSKQYSLHVVEKQIRNILTQDNQ